MENQTVKHFIEETVREEIRKGNLVKSKDVLSILPEVVDTVHVDRKKLRSSIERCLSSNNPFNSILNLFGVQLIRKNKTIDRLLDSGAESGEVNVKIDDSYAKRWLTVKPKEFKAVIEKIAQKLYELEIQANRTYDDEKTRGDELFSKYEKLEREHKELQFNADNNEKMVAERIQSILSIGGKDAASDNEQLIGLLRDLDIEVYWDSIDAPLKDSVMFTEYTLDEGIAANTKPCLVRNNAVYVKGIRFIRK